MNEYLREYEFEDESLPVVKVCQNPSTELGHGGTVWDAALVLCAFLESNQGKALITGARCIELGAGTGIVSIAALTVGATQALATDLAVCVPFIKQNIGLNPQASTCRAAELDWSTDQASRVGETYDWILCADCVFAPDLVPGLVNAINALKPTRGVIVSNERRGEEANASAEKHFIKALYEAGYEGKAVHKDVIRPDWRCDDIDVVVFEQKSSDSCKGA
jgi:ribosomal protein L11 methylase PrmA